MTLRLCAIAYVTLMVALAEPPRAWEEVSLLSWILFAVVCIATEECVVWIGRGIRRQAAKSDTMAA